MNSVMRSWECIHSTKRIHRWFGWVTPLTVIISQTMTSLSSNGYFGLTSSILALFPGPDHSFWLLAVQKSGESLVFSHVSMT